MSRTSSHLMFIVFVAAACTCGLAKASEPVSLFDGKTLNGWDVITCGAVIKENAILSARITHNHSEGLAGAVAQATAVGLALEHGLSNEPIEPGKFLDRITAQVIDIDKGFAESLDALKSIPRDSMLEIIEAIAARYTLSLRAVESVPAAIGAFALTDSFRDAVVLAVNLGGDTDTIGAMAGAIAGAYYGYGQIPKVWLKPLENAAKGRDYVINCVKQIVLDTG